MAQLVFTFMAPDEPGIVERIAGQVKSGDGNWLESQLARMAGQFAGIVLVEAAADKIEGLTQALRALEGDDFQLSIDTSSESLPDSSAELFQIEVLGNDRPGIVKEVSAVLSKHRINIIELSAAVNSAPMAGTPLFKAKLLISPPADWDRPKVASELEGIGAELDLEVSLNAGTPT